MTETDRRTRSEPETFRARTIVPSLTVDDLAVSRRWYVDVVGFHLAEEYTHEGEVRGVRLAAGTVELLLSQDDGAKGARTKGQGMSFNLDTVQDVDELAARIRARGGSLESEPEDHPWGIRSFRLRDPDGFAWTIGTEI